MARSALRALLLVVALGAGSAWARGNALRITTPILGLEYSRELMPGLWVGPRASYGLLATVPLYDGIGQVAGGFGLLLDLAFRQRNRAEGLELGGVLAVGLAGYRPVDREDAHSTVYVSLGGELGYAGFWLTVEAGGLVPNVSAETSETFWRAFATAKLGWQLEF